MRTYTVRLDDEALEELRTAESLKKQLALDIAKQLVDRMELTMTVTLRDGEEAE